MLDGEFWVDQVLELVLNIEESGLAILLKSELERQ